MLDDDVVLFDVSGGRASVTLNRPDRMNAFNQAQHRALYAALESAMADDGVRSILLTGAGRAFCAGQDLDEVNPGGATEAPDLGSALENFYNPLIRLIRRIEKPVICAVNGVAAGAGANLALACDIVLAARSAQFIQVFCRIGLIPDSGGTWFLTHFLGEARAKGLALTGAPLDAGTAAEWGLIWRMVEDDELMGEALKLADSLATGPTTGLGLAKLAIQKAGANALDAQLDLERDLQRVAGRTADYAEGVASFFAKRKPAFAGR